MSAIIVVALDLGVKTGWAIAADGRIESGVQVFDLRRGESGGMRYVHFRRWLQELLLNSVNDPGRREELAWAAGFFDGEGYVGFHESYTRPYKRDDGTTAEYRADKLTVQVGQSGSGAMELLERFRKAIGGMGVINGPYHDKRFKLARPRWQYRAGGVADATQIIQLLWPWLGPVKRAQAEDAVRNKLCAMSKIPRFGGVRGLILYELPHHRGGYTTAVHSSLAGLAQEFCAQHGYEYQAVHTATLKKWTVGSGRADKDAMRDAALRRGWISPATTDDNEIDALALLHYGLSEVVPRGGPP